MEAELEIVTEATKDRQCGAGMRLGDYARELSLLHSASADWHNRVLCWSGLPKLVLHEAVFKHHEHMQSPGWAKAYTKLDAELQSGYLCAVIGPSGTGKTILAAALIDSACQKDQARYERIGDLFRQVRATFRNGYTGPTEQEIFARAVSASLLVLDEAQERGSSPWENTLLNDLIGMRFAEGRSTLLLSNHPNAETFGQAIGDSISSRMHERGGLFTFNWTSFRKAGKWGVE